MNRVVLFQNGGNPLLLANVERDSSGDIKAGIVVNGRWRLEITDVEMLACHLRGNSRADNRIVNRWLRPNLTEFPVPSDWDDDEYNEIIAKAEKARK